MPLNTVVSAPVIPDPLGSDGNSSDSEGETNDTTQRFVRFVLGPDMVSDCCINYIVLNSKDVRKP